MAPAKVAALRALPSQVTVLDDRPGLATFALSNDVPQPLTGTEHGTLLRPVRTSPRNHERDDQRDDQRDDLHDDSPDDRPDHLPDLPADDPLAALLRPGGGRLTDSARRPRPAAPGG